MLRAGLLLAHHSCVVLVHLADGVLALALLHALEETLLLARAGGPIFVCFLPFFFGGFKKIRSQQLLNKRLKSLRQILGSSEGPRFHPGFTHVSPRFHPGFNREPLWNYREPLCFNPEALWNYPDQQLMVSGMLNFQLLIDYGLSN